MRTEQTQHFKNYERENSRSKQIVADLPLDDLIIKKALKSKLLCCTRWYPVVGEIKVALNISEHRTWEANQQTSFIPMYEPLVRKDEELLT